MIGVALSLSIIRAKRSIIVLKPDQQASEAEILAHACERIASYKLRNRLILRCTAAHTSGKILVAIRWTAGG